MTVTWLSELIPSKYSLLEDEKPKMEDNTIGRAFNNMVTAIVLYCVHFYSQKCYISIKTVVKSKQIVALILL